MKKFALIIVDMQNGFTPLCPNELPVAGGHLLVPRIMDALRSASFVVGSADMHPPTAPWITANPEDIAQPMVNGELMWPAHCISGTFGAELIEGLPRPTEMDYFVWKGCTPDLHPYSCVYHDLNKKLTTGVVEVLRSRGIDTVYVTGLALDYCVASTANDLSDAGFNVVLSHDTTAPVSDDITNTLETFNAAGIHMCATVEEAIEVINEY